MPSCHVFLLILISISVKNGWQREGGRVSNQYQITASVRTIQARPGQRQGWSTGGCCPPAGSPARVSVKAGRRQTASSMADRYRKR